VAGGSVVCLAVAGPALHGFYRVALVGLTVVAFGVMAGGWRRRLASLASEKAESDRRAELLHVAATASQDISRLDPDEVLSAVCRAATQVGFDMAEIDVADEARTTFIPLHATGLPPEHTPQPQPITAGIAGIAYRSGETIFIPDYTAWQGGITGVRALNCVGTCGATPVWTDEGIVAVLTAATFEVREIKEYEQECLRLLALQAGVALQNAHRFDERRRQETELMRQAYHDELTGLPNRALFQQRLRGRSLSGAPPLSAVLFIDLDGFKAANDAHGHLVGDRLLVTVAQRLAEVVRTTDTLARFGGDEFTILLHRISSPDEASDIAQRVLTSLSQPVMIEGTRLCISASIGIAVGNPTVSGETMLERADAAMYEAKTRGKNRYELAAEGLPAGPLRPASDEDG
jgi:diguanylate cyclase (GGDEF)-like protein